MTSVSYPLKSLEKASQLSIHLLSFKDPPNSSYYLNLKVSGGEALVFGRSEDAYPHGQLYANGEAQPTDISFRLSYEYGLAAVLSDVASWLNQIWLIFPLVAVLWLPGRILLRLTGFDRRLDGGERAAAAAGLSMAILPVILLWTSTIGIHWNRTAILISISLLALVYAWLSRKDVLHRLSHWRSIRIEPAAIALCVIFIFSLGVRLAMVRDYAAPAWIDSVHHALLTRLILESGAYPSTLVPFLDIAETSYHSGFHSLAAAFTWLSNLELTQSLLLFGQVLNAVAVLAVYLLTTSLSHNAWAGVFAALITGLVTPMPAYYASWGRYTQLAGLIILPTAWIFILLLIEQWRPLQKDRRQMITAASLASLSCAGLFLVHYRVLGFLAILIFAWMIVRILQNRLHTSLPRVLPGALYACAAVGILTVLFSYPWWPGMIRSLLTPSLALTGVPQPFSGFSWSFLNPALGKYALGLAGLGLLWGLIQRRAFPVVISIWVGFLFMAGNLGVLSLPGAALITNLSVTIMLFMPVSLLSGYLLAWVFTGWTAVIPPRWRFLYITLITVLVTVFGIFAARALMPILNPGTILYRQADAPAIEWLSENLPENTTVLVNPFLWGYDLYAGLDGGYWISPSALRRTIPPPVLYGLNYTERSFVPISQLNQEIMKNVKNPLQLHDLLVKNEIEYIFIGARGGPLSPATLSSSALYHQIYVHDGAYIYQVVR